MGRLALIAIVMSSNAPSLNLEICNLLLCVLIVWLFSGLYPFHVGSVVSIKFNFISVIDIKRHHYNRTIFQGGLFQGIG